MFRINVSQFVIVTFSNYHSNAMTVLNCCLKSEGVLFLKVSKFNIALSLEYETIERDSWQIYTQTGHDHLWYFFQPIFWIKPSILYYETCLSIESILKKQSVWTSTVNQISGEDYSILVILSEFFICIYIHNTIYEECYTYTQTKSYSTKLIWPKELK